MPDVKGAAIWSTLGKIARERREEKRKREEEERKRKIDFEKEKRDLMGDILKIKIAGDKLKLEYSDQIRPSQAVTPPSGIRPRQPVAPQIRQRARGPFQGVLPQGVRAVPTEPKPPETKPLLTRDPMTGKIISQTTIPKNAVIRDISKPVKAGEAPKASFTQDQKIKSLSAGLKRGRVALVTQFGEPMEFEIKTWDQALDVISRFNLDPNLFKEELKKYDDTRRIEVIDKKGNRYTIPKQQVDEARRQGFFVIGE